MKKFEISVPDLKAAIDSENPPIVIDVRREPAFMSATEMISGALRRDPAGVAMDGPRLN